MKKTMATYKRLDGSTVEIDVELVMPFMNPARWEIRVMQRKKFHRSFSYEPSAATEEEKTAAAKAYWKLLDPEILK